MSKKYIFGAVFFLTNLAVYTFAFISGYMHGTSGGVAINDGHAVVALAGQAITVFFFLVGGPSLVFHIAARHSDSNPLSVGLFAAINVFSAIFWSSQYVTQTDSSRVFFFAIHWAVSCLVAIFAAALIRPPKQCQS